ncbi:MAG: threonine aldolase [Phenylobacterium sp.]|nr:threonine aldolase [Phenylobacterium sp.]
MNARYDFASDNTAPAAPEAMAAILEANRGFTSGYGSDAVSARAAELVRGLLDVDAEVRFVASGTAANAISVAALARPFEAVLAHEHAHICTDEAGAPGYFGQGMGLIGLPGASGRIDPAALASALEAPEVSYHQPAAALSVTNATEYGTVYTAGELERLIAPVKAKGYGVHLDGARIANAAAAGFDLTAIKGLGVDLFVLGGAKAGMPPTEALVILNPKLARRIDPRLKQAGQLPSKGRFYAAPFIGMLQDGALTRHAAHANAMARKLAQAMPFKVAHPVEANAVFVEMEEPALERLHASGWFAYRFLDGTVRFVCSWATTEAAVDEVLETLKGLV